MALHAGADGTGGGVSDKRWRWAAAWALGIAGAACWIGVAFYVDPLLGWLLTGGVFVGTAVTVAPR